MSSALLYEASQAGVKIRPAGARHVLSSSRDPGHQREHRSHQHRRPIPRAQPHLLFPQWRSEEIYLGSADLMPRNINRRVETLFPLEDEALIQHVKNDLLSVYLADTAKARRMNSDGTYTA